jgi:maltokinase
MDSTLGCVAAWMPRQRWYAGKGRVPSLHLVAWWDMSSDDPGARVRTYLLVDEGALPPVLYQVPVVERETVAVTADPDHVIGSPEPGTTLIDGPFDPAYTRALERLVTEGGECSGPAARAVGHPEGEPVDGSPRSAQVLTGEQSNTSVVFRGDADALICKIYRQVNGGLNPDIELSSALSAAGSPYVPRAVGALEGTWPHPSDPSRTITGSLAFAQQFLTGVEDAWRVALRAAADGEAFDREAFELGEATANVHGSLSELFPTRAATPEDRDATVQAWARRLAIAIAEVPAITDLKEAIETVYAAASQLAWPRLQRIHGDFHLGQVLLVPDRGWVLLDFEGEPLRPMRERVLPDLALRDVAGMLRSFDYVAGSLRLDDPDRPPDVPLRWARSARDEFVRGYAAGSGEGLDDVGILLAALELDKAVYESIYEARNRPTWVAIPLRAIERLVVRLDGFR